MITIHYESEAGVRYSDTVPVEQRVAVCKNLLEMGYWLVGESWWLNQKKRMMTGSSAMQSTAG